ncbi:H-NS histone family protein [Leisingera sp. ANG-M7]|uniref:H-NS histone family protein n=1 Tax=Leisingera sp. ANG-M7 TaxID=1577902 RepID=UPI00057F7AEF|nr:H-NS histone family protein [Leisingera sp. ANG-M7]KIC35920.1 histone-like nucleoid-structuring protein H-NS [Leisingera sp. ANG-M7]
MAIDITTLNVSELEALSKEIETRKIQVAEEAKQNAYNEMLAIAAKHGVSFEEVVALHSGKGRRSGLKAAAKYANPNDPSQTWSGRGRKPGWVHEALEAGKSLKDIEI